MFVTAMNILFVHQNFPAQFVHLAPALAKKGHRVMALTINQRQALAGVELVQYKPQKGNTPNIHPWALDFETKIIRGEAALHAAMQLKAQGFTPDLIIAHPGWGESLFLKDVWPQAKLAIYCEFYYQSQGADCNFDPEFSKPDAVEPSRLRVKNINHDLHLQMADAAIAPTHYQASVFPTAHHSRIKVIHDGINTELVKPNPNAQLFLSRGITLDRNTPVITFVNRNLEPTRGYHRFMRALPAIQQRHPNSRIVIVGGNEVSYGQAAPKGHTWKQIFLDEVKSQLDMSRIHFVGKIAYGHFLQLLQISRVHVYLTYPFVLSWSLLEAMSSECAIVASNTAPVREFIEHNNNGLLVDFFSTEQLVNAVSELLNNEMLSTRLGANARKTIVQGYDLHSKCLPEQLAWVEALHKSIEG